MCLNLKVFCERCIKGSVVPTTRCKKKTFLRVLETFRPVHSHHGIYSFLKLQKNVIKNFMTVSSVYVMYNVLTTYVQIADCTLLDENTVGPRIVLILGQRGTNLLQKPQ